MQDSKKQKIIKDIAGVLIILAFLAIMAAVFVFVGKPLVKFISDPEKFRLWVDENGIFGRFGYIGMIMLQIFVAVIPGEVFELYGGYAFGFVEGTLLYMIGSVLGSMAVFFFVRTFGSRVVKLFFSDKDIHSLKFLRKNKKRDIVLFILFLIPGTPKDLLCYYAGLTDISWKKWLLISSVGRIPSVLSSTGSGSALGTQDYTVAIVVLAVTVLISGIGLLFYRGYVKRHGEEKTEK